MASLILEITANVFLWEFLYKWYNNAALNNSLWTVDPPTKLLVSTGAECVAIIILALTVLLNACLACKNQGFKDVYVGLITGSSGSRIWKLTESDLPVSNLLLRSASDIKTGF